MVSFGSGRSGGVREVSWELRTHLPTPYPSSSLVNTFPAEMVWEGRMDLLKLPSQGLGDLAKAQVPGLGRVPLEMTSCGRGKHGYPLAETGSSSL